MIVPRYYEDLKIVHENTMPYRAYYMPSSHDMGPLVENRYASDRVTELNGTWQFQYFKSIYDLEEKFYELGYDCSKFTKVEVPGVWQPPVYQCEIPDSFGPAVCATGESMRSLYQEVCISETRKGSESIFEF